MLRFCFCSVLGLAAAAAVAEIPVDSNNRVAENLLLVRASAPAEWTQLRAIGRRTILSDDPLLFESPHVVAACVWKGFPVQYLNESTQTAALGDDLEDFVLTKCNPLEIGFISYFEGETLTITYVDSNGKLAPRSTNLKAGEKNTAWVQSTPTHRFLVKGSTFEQVYEAVVPSIFMVGTPPDYTKLGATITEQQQLARVKQELGRVSKIKRVFTDVGFKKVPVPVKAWAEISTYYYNNKYNRAREEWINTGFFVNWHEVNQDLVVPPFGLTRRWKALIQPVMERWTNTTLEPTDMYGIRVYKNGAWLSNHVDREATHAVSGIINVEQVGLEEEWEVHIWDIHGNRQRVSMEPGSMLLYESARCMHGRPVPLVGREYANIFVHYRPVGKPKWYVDETVGKPGPDVSAKFDPLTAQGHEIGWVGEEARRLLPPSPSQTIRAPRDDL